MAGPGIDVGKLRELVLLAGGVAALAVGLATRDPATSGVGVTLLVAVPAVAKKDNSGGGT